MQADFYIINLKRIIESQQEDFASKYPLHLREQAGSEKCLHFNIREARIPEAWPPLLPWGQVLEQRL